MSYIGKEPIVGNFQKCDAITTSSTATYNLTVSSAAVFPETANNCIVSLNGVIQAPTSAYTISGSQIVFASSLTSSDVIDFILILGSVLSVGTPTDRTVTLAKMATGTDGQIITYDTSGNPTAVGPGSDGQVLTSTGAGSPPAFEAIPGGGMTVADQWRLTTTFTDSINPIASNLERVDTTAGGQAMLGSAMTVSSGIFTFPSTGFYQVQYNLLQQSTDGNVRGYGGGAIFATVDNSSYVTVSQTFGATPAISGTSRMSNSCSTIIDVTDTSNVKVKFSVEMQNSAMGTMGSTESNQTHMTFLRLGDT